MLLLTSMLALSGCNVIKGIFKLGFGVGIALAVMMVVVFGGLFALLRK